MLNDVGGSENQGAQLLICWAYFAPVVERELTDQFTDLPRSRIAMANPGPLVMGLLTVGPFGHACKL